VADISSINSGFEALGGLFRLQQANIQASESRAEESQSRQYTPPEDKVESVPFVAESFAFDRSAPQLDQAQQKFILNSAEQPKIINPIPAEEQTSGKITAPVISEDETQKPEQNGPNILAINANSTKNQITAPLAVSDKASSTESPKNSSKPDNNQGIYNQFGQVSAL